MPISPENPAEGTNIDQTSVNQEWIDSVLLPALNSKGNQAKTGAQSTRDFSQYGLQNAEEVDEFLHTEAGEELLEEIEEAQALEAEQRTQAQKAQAETTFIHRAMAALFLYTASQAAHANHKKTDLVNEQVEAQLHKKHETPSSDASEGEKRKHSQEAMAQQASEIMQQYQEVVKDLHEQKLSAEIKGIELELQKDKLTAEGANIETKYSQYEKSLKTLENEDGSPKELTTTQIKAEIESLTGDMEQKLVEIDSKITNNQDAEASALLQEFNASNLKLASLKDQLAVQEGKKYYTNEAGEKVDSAKDATSIMDAKENKQSKGKILEKDGKFYLLEKGQDWSSIAENKQAQEKAQQKYQVAKSESMVVKKVVSHNKGLETTDNAARLKENKSQINTNQTEQMNIRNQLLAVNAARSNLADFAKSQNLDMSLPSVSSSANLGSVKSIASSAHSTAVFKEQLNSIRNKGEGNISKDDFSELADNAPDSFKPAAANVSQQITRMLSRGNVPQTTMLSLLQSLERFGVDADKDGMTAIKDINEIKRDNAMDAPLERVSLKPTSSSTHDATSNKFKEASEKAEALREARKEQPKQDDHKDEHKVESTVKPKMTPSPFNN